ncbi:MAG: response regulator transcription factor [Chloroflexi bacterium]|nr:response regulator transcription factor [Chloroflexota bacterium]
MPMAEKVLVIDDDESIVWLVSTLLKHDGFDVVEALSAEDGLKLAYQKRPDLVLLDVMMPGMDGWEVCRRLRELSEVPIIFLTAKTGITDVVRGLEMGADDYLVKPFDNRELVARVRAHLRRTPAQQNADQLIFDNGNVTINFLNRDVRVRGNLVELTPKEFELLAVLARNAGRVLTRSELVNQVWGPNYSGANESLKLYIHYLRKKIEANAAQPDYILTSRGVGYRFANK